MHDRPAHQSRKGIPHSEFAHLLPFPASNSVAHTFASWRLSNRERSIVFQASLLRCGTHLESVATCDPQPRNRLGGPPRTRAPMKLSARHKRPRKPHFGRAEFKSSAVDRVCESQSCPRVWRHSGGKVYRLPYSTP